MDSISSSAEWMALKDLQRQWQSRRVADAFAVDPDRAQGFSAQAAGIFLDYSRQRLDEPVLDALSALSSARGFETLRDALWRGEALNHTENRAALHMALRAEAGDGVGNAESRAFVKQQREQLHALVERVRSGEWQSSQGARFEHVVHVGIGGSHLGPALAIDVLETAMPDVDGPEVHFVSTTDPAPLARLMRRLPRERTLLVLVSKSFTTAETSLNAETLVEWLAEGRERARVMREQVVAISANREAVIAAGIRDENLLPMPEWAGGRYSLWSAVGLPVALRFGMRAFNELLAGARAMDLNFRDAAPRDNLAWLLGMIGIWNINFQQAATHAVLPYTEALALFPDYLQQLEMESNGKRVDRNGQVVDYQTAPVIWGGVGMNGQHAFFQQLHQGTAWTPIDFILVRQPDHGLPRQHASVLANGLAQAEALMQGRDDDSVKQQERDPALVPYKTFPGDRPSTTLLLEKLDAHTLGALIALYEHKVFTQSVIWNINPFDQYGVELGKKIAKDVEPWLTGEQGGDVDASTRQLLEKLKSNSQD